MDKLTEWNGEELPEWALQRVCDLTNVDGSHYAVGQFTVKNCQGYSIGKAFAAYIAAHEEPPVDPVDAIVRDELAKAYDLVGWKGHSEHAGGGKYDTNPAFVAAKRLYLAGIEKGKGV